MTRSMVKILQGILIPTILLITTHPSSGQWLGFEIDQTIPTQNPIYQLAVAHANSDSFLDIIGLPSDNFSQGLVFTGNSQQQFSYTSLFTKQENYRVLESGDINGDGIDDLAISGYWNNGFQIFWGNASGQYSAGDHYALTGHGKNLKIIDINKDGANDIIALSGGSGQPITLHVFIGNNSRTIAPKGIYSSQLDTDKRITIVDKNEDGLLDIMVASSFPWFVIFYQQADGSFKPQYWPYKIEFPFTSEYYLEDYDNDGQQDILAHYFDEGFRFYSGIRDTVFNTEYKSLRLNLQPSRIFTTDLNQDGFKDIIMNNYTSEFEPTNMLYYMLGKGDFTFNDIDSVLMPGLVDRFIISDYNNDGLPDIITYCKNVGIVTVLNKGLVTDLGDESLATSFYPSPFEDMIYVPQNLEFSSISVHDVNGNLIGKVLSNQKEIDARQWPCGVYILKVSNNKKIYTSKVVKR